MLAFSWYTILFRTTLSLLVDISKVCDLLVRGICQTQHPNLALSKIYIRSGLIIAPPVLPDQVKPKDDAKDQGSSKADDHGQEARRVTWRFILKEELWPNDVAQTVRNEHLVSVVSHRRTRCAIDIGCSRVGTYHRIRSVLLREATDIATRHAQDQREVRRVCDAKAVSDEPRPNVGGI